MMMIGEEQYDLLVEVTVYYFFVLLAFLVKCVYGNYFLWLIPFSWIYVTGLRLFGYPIPEYVMLWWI